MDSVTAFSKIEQVEVLLIDLLNPNASISLLLLLLMTSLNIKLIFINPFIFFFPEPSYSWHKRENLIGNFIQQQIQPYTLLDNRSAKYFNHRKSYKGHL